jgi:hypothetical protein
MSRWVRVKCSTCGGHGVVSDYGNGEDFYGPKECDGCAAGTVAVSERDRVALWPGGPLRGSWPGEFAAAVARGCAVEERGA